MSGCDTVLAVNDDGLPSICGWEPLIENALLESAAKPQYLPESRTDFGRSRSTRSPIPPYEPPKGVPTPARNWRNAGRRRAAAPRGEARPEAWRGRWISLV